MAFLSPFALLALGAMPPPQAVFDPEPSPRECPPPVVTVNKPDAGKPTVRKLGEEPPAMQIAAVHAEVGGCPVMLVVDGGATGVGRGWTPAPETDLHPAE
jgi:hypothetical protein